MYLGCSVDGKDVVINIENGLASAIAKEVVDQGHGDMQLSPKMVRGLMEKFADPASADYVRAGKVDKEGNKKKPPHCSTIKIHTDLTAQALVDGLANGTIGKRGRNGAEAAEEGSVEIDVDVADLL